MFCAQRCAAVRRLAPQGGARRWQGWGLPVADAKRKELVRRTYFALEDAQEAWEVLAALQQLMDLGIVRPNTRAMAATLHKLVIVEGPPLPLHMLAYLARALFRREVLADMTPAPVVSFIRQLWRAVTRRDMRSVMWRTLEVERWLDAAAAHLLRPTVAAAVDRTHARIVLESYAHFRHRHAALTALCLEVAMRPPEDAAEDAAGGAADVDTARSGDDEALTWKLLPDGGTVEHDPPPLSRRAPQISASQIDPAAGFEFPDFAGPTAGRGAAPTCVVLPDVQAPKGKAARRGGRTRERRAPPAEPSVAALAVWEVAVFVNALARLEVYEGGFYTAALEAVRTRPLRMGACRPRHLARMVTGFGAYLAQAPPAEVDPTTVAVVFHKLAEALVEHWLPDGNELSMIAKVLEAFRDAGVVGAPLWEGVCALLTAEDSPFAALVDAANGTLAEAGFREDRVLLRLLEVLWWGHAAEARRGRGAWLPVLAGVNAVSLRLLHCAAAGRLSQGTAGGICAFYIASKAGEGNALLPRSLEALARKARANGLHDPLRMLQTSPTTLLSILEVYTRQGDPHHDYLHTLCDVVVWRLTGAEKIDMLDTTVPDPEALLAALPAAGVAHPALEALLRQRRGGAAPPPSPPLRPGDGDVLCSDDAHRLLLIPADPF